MSLIWFFFNETTRKNYVVRKNYIIYLILYIWICVLQFLLQIA